MDPEKPLSDDGRARAERNRQEALLRLQRTRSAQSGSIPQSHKKGFNDSSGVKLCAGLPNATSVAQAKANLSRTISAPTRAGLSQSIHGRPRGISSKTDEVLVCSKRPPLPDTLNYSRKAKIPALESKSPNVRAVCVLISRKEFEVQARYHAGLLAVFKSLPTRVYDENTKKWSFNLSDYREFLKKASGLDGIQLEGLSSAVVTTFKEQIDGIKSTSDNGWNENLFNEIPRQLIDCLLSFQREGVEFALKHDGRVLLADDMGLGKTVQSLAIAAAYRSEWPLLIVCQLSLRCAWREAVITWLGSSLNLTLSDIHVVESLSDALNKIQHLWSRKLVTIFTYDLLSRYVEKMGPSALTNFKVVIMDESHNLKNFKASRTQAALPVLKGAKRAILLTGTPALSRPIELYPQIIGLRPNLFRGGVHEFGLRYCDAKETTWGWDYKGCSNLQELQILLQETIMIRRIKSEILKKLPSKSRHVKLLDANLMKKKSSGPKNSQSVKLVSLDLIVSIAGVEKHGEILRLFKETCQSKIAAVSQYVTGLLESERKFILYAHHQEMLDAMTRLMEVNNVEYIRIDGKTQSEQRGAYCNQFQTYPSCRVALLSITAASTGLNLTASNLVVFAELYWNPGVLVQAEDRAHRIGQKDPVEIHYLLASGTVDEQLWSLVKTKLDVLSQVGLSKESFDDISLTRVKSAEVNEVPRIDQFFKIEDKSPSTTEEGYEKESRISILPPTPLSPPNFHSECGGGLSSQILVPESPPPSFEATDSLYDGADELLLDVLETAVLDESVL